MSDASSGSGYGAAPKKKVLVKRKPTPAPRTDAQTSGDNYGLTGAQAYQARQSHPRPPTFSDQMNPTLLAKLHPRNPLAQSAQSAIITQQSKKDAQGTYRRAVRPAAMYEIRALWRAAAPLFGKSPKSQPPFTDVTNQRVTPTRWASTTDVGTRLPTVKLPAEFADMAGHATSPTLRILLHEWAHYHQKAQPKTDGKAAGGLNPVLEGGAEAFTDKHIRDVTRDAGVPSAWDRRHVYDTYLKWVKKHRSGHWIDRGQFQSRPPQ